MLSRPPLRNRKEVLASSPSRDEDDSADADVNCFAPYIAETVSTVDFIFLASYHSVSSSPSARRPSSAFDGVNEEANVRANAAVVPGYADVCASAVMTDDNN